MKNNQDTFFKLALPQNYLIGFNNDPILFNKTQLTFKENIIEFKTNPIKFPINEIAFHNYRLPYDWGRKYNQVGLKKETVTNYNRYNNVNNLFYCQFSLPVNLPNKEKSLIFSDRKYIGSLSNKNIPSRILRSKIEFISNHYKKHHKINDKLSLDELKQVDPNILNNYKIGTNVFETKLVVNSVKANLQAYRYFNGFRTLNANQTQTEISRSITFFASLLGNLKSLKNNSARKENQNFKSNRIDPIKNVTNQQTRNNNKEISYSLATSNISNIKNTVFAKSKTLTNFVIDANNKSFLTSKNSSFDCFLDEYNVSKSKNVLDAEKSCDDANSFLTSSRVFGRQRTQTEVTRASSFFAKSIGFNFSKLMHEKESNSELDTVARVIKQAKVFEYKKTTDDDLKLSKLTDLDELRSIVQNPNELNKSLLSKSYKELQDHFFNLNRSSQNKTDTNSRIESVNNEIGINKNYINNNMGGNRSFEINTSNASRVSNTFFSNVRAHTNVAINSGLQNRKLKNLNRVFNEHSITLEPQEGIKQAFTYLTNVNSFKASQTKTDLSRSITFFARSISNNLLRLFNDSSSSYAYLKPLKDTKPSRKGPINNITNQQITNKNREVNYSIVTSNNNNIKNTILAKSKTLTNFVIDANNKSFSSGKSSSFECFSDNYNISKSQNVLDAVQSSHDANSFLTSSRVFGRQKTQTELTRASSFFAKSIGYNFSKLMDEKEKNSELDTVTKFIKQAKVFEQKKATYDPVEFLPLTDLDELRSIVQDPNIINKSWLSKGYKELQEQFFNLSNSNQNKTDSHSRTRSVNNKFETNKNHINNNMEGAKSRNLEINTNNASNVASNINTTIFSNVKGYTNFAIDSGLQNRKLKNLNRAFNNYSIKLESQEGVKQAHSYLSNAKSLKASQTKTELSRSISFFARAISNNLSSLLNDKPNNIKNKILNPSVKAKVDISNNRESQIFSAITSDKQIQNCAEEAKITNRVLKKHAKESAIFSTEQSKLLKLFEKTLNKNRYQDRNLNFKKVINEANFRNNSFSNIKKHDLEKKYYSSIKHSTNSEIQIVNEIKGIGDQLGTQLQYLGGKIQAFNQAIAKQNSQIITGISSLNSKSNQRVRINSDYHSPIIDLPMSFKDPL